MRVRTRAINDIYFRPFSHDKTFIELPLLEKRVCAIRLIENWLLQLFQGSKMEKLFIIKVLIQNLATLYPGEINKNLQSENCPIGIQCKI